jgi:hypothetical protein
MELQPPPRLFAERFTGTPDYGKGHPIEGRSRHAIKGRCARTKRYLRPTVVVFSDGRKLRITRPIGQPS